MKAAAQKRTAIVWSVLAVISVMMIAAPSVWDLDMDSGGGALIFVGILLLITSVITASIYFSRASTLTKMFSGENLLVDWQQPEEGGGRTIISMDGIITNEILYTFKDLACTLTKVELKPSSTSPRQIVLSIEVPTRFGTKLEVLDVPIPEGQTDRARAVAEALRTRHLGKTAG